MKKDTILAISIYTILEFLNYYYDTFPTYVLCEVFKASYPRITRFLLEQAYRKEFFLFMSISQLQYSIRVCRIPQREVWVYISPSVSILFK